MGTDKLTNPFLYKKATSGNITIVSQVSNSSKSRLVKITSEQIKSKRCSAYKYLLP